MTPDYVIAYLIIVAIKDIINLTSLRANYYSIVGRNRCALSFFLFFFPFCSIAQLTSRIDCYLPQIKDSTECKLVVKRPERDPLINSTLVLDGHAVFVVNIPEPAPAYIWIENRKEDVNLFIDSSDIRLAFSTQLADPPRIAGSLATELWKQQDSLLTRLVERHTELRSALIEIPFPNDSLGILEQYERRSDSLQITYLAALTKLIADHPEASSSWYLYASRFSALPYLTKVQLFTKLSSFISYPSYKEIQKVLSMNRLGQKASNFELPTLKNGRLTLSNLKGKYILLEFSSTYSASSKRRHKALQKLYAAYHSQGLEIVTISQEFDSQQAQAALSHEQLPWPVLLDIEGQSNVFANYQMGYTSNAILLDSSKKVIARDISIQDLDDKLGKLFAQ